jgi:hypothetical protein
MLHTSIKMLQSIQQVYKHCKLIITQYTDPRKCAISTNIDPDHATVFQYNIKESHLHGEVFHIEYVDPTIKYILMLFFYNLVFQVNVFQQIFAPKLCI